MDVEFDHLYPEGQGFPKGNLRVLRIFSGVSSVSDYVYHGDVLLRVSGVRIQNPEFRIATPDFRLLASIKKHFVMPCY